MAASRTASPSGSPRTASGRISFGKIREPLEVPNLLALQTDSFDWLLGNAKWQSRVEAALEGGRQDGTDGESTECTHARDATATFLERSKESDKPAAAPLGLRVPKPGG